MTKKVLHSPIQHFLNESGHKSNKTWVDQGVDFTAVHSDYGYMIVTLKCIQHNEGKHVVAERFIRTLKHKIYKYMNPLSKQNVYIDKLDKMADKYNNLYYV